MYIEYEHATSAAICAYMYIYSAAAVTALPVAMRPHNNHKYKNAAFVDVGAMQEEGAHYEQLKNLRHGGNASAQS